MLMEGCIEHTNEIMVLLGDNWFLERSAKESIDIINRRQDKIRASIEKLTEEKEKTRKVAEHDYFPIRRRGGFS